MKFRQKTETILESINKMTEDGEEEHTVLSEITLKIKHSSVCSCLSLCIRGTALNG